MKKLIGLVLLSSLFMVACSSNEASESVNEETNTEVTEVDSEVTQEDLDAKLKEEATQADFVELNSDDAETGKKVFAEGTVETVTTDGTMGEFTLTTSEGDGSGMYTIVNVMGTEVLEGDTVTIYGVYEGKDDLGFPMINATVIE